MLLVSACSGLSNEPDIIRTLPPPILERFEEPVSLQTGAAIYAENCVRCHGITGAGNGELVLSGALSNIPDFTDPATIQDKSLQTWFDVITNGRIETLMPPWRQALSVSDRWAVALYTYTLSYDAAVVTHGQELYAANCASCHGQIGEVSADVPSLVGLINPTENELQRFLHVHQSEVDTTLSLSESDLAALVQYLRMLSTTTRTLPKDFVQPVVTEERAPQALGTIRGQIIQGTVGGSSVVGLEAVLHIVDGQSREQVVQQIVGEDGSYQFEDMVIRPDFSYVITVNKQGMIFSSQVATGDINIPDKVLDVTIYEITDDPAVIEVNSRAIQINLTPQGLYIIEVIDVTNISADRVYAQDRMVEGDGWVSVSVPIPEGAQLQPDHTDLNRFALSVGGREVLDLRPVLPGTQHYIQFAYSLPFSDSLTIPLLINYQTADSIEFYVDGNHLTLTGEGIEFSRNADFDGSPYRVYKVSSTPEMGQLLTYQISLPTSEEPPVADPTITRAALAAILVLSGVVLLGIAFFVYWRQSRNEADNTNAQDIMIKIAQLDKQFETGDIKKSVYQKQRNMLKSRLIQKMKSHQD